MRGFRMWLWACWSPSATNTSRTPSAMLTSGCWRPMWLSRWALGWWNGGWMDMDGLVRGWVKRDGDSWRLFGFGEGWEWECLFLAFMRSLRPGPAGTKLAIDGHTRESNQWSFRPSWLKHIPSMLSDRIKQRFNVHHCSPLLEFLWCESSKQSVGGSCMRWSNFQILFDSNKWSKSYVWLFNIHQHPIYIRSLCLKHITSPPQLYCI